MYMTRCFSLLFGKMTCQIYYFKLFMAKKTIIIAEIRYNLTIFYQNRIRTFMICDKKR